MPTIAFLVNEKSDISYECMRALQSEGFTVYAFYSRERLFASMRIINPDLIVWNVSRNMHDAVHSFCELMTVFAVGGRVSVGLIGQSSLEFLANNLLEQGLIDFSLLGKVSPAVLLEHVRSSLSHKLVEHTL